MPLLFLDNIIPNRPVWYIWSVMVNLVKTFLKEHSNFHSTLFWRYMQGTTGGKAWPLAGFWEIENGGEVATNMAALPAKNLPWRPWIMYLINIKQINDNIVLPPGGVHQNPQFFQELSQEFRPEQNIAGQKMFCSGPNKILGKIGVPWYWWAPPGSWRQLYVTFSLGIFIECL